MSTTMKWGLITGAVYVIFSLISNILGLQDGASAGMAGLSFVLNFVLMIVTFFTIYLGVKEIRDQDQGGYISFGEAFKKGLTIAVIAGVVSGIFTLLYMTVIDPTMSEMIIQRAEEQLEQSNAPEEQREMTMKFTKYISSPLFLSPFILLYIALWGLFKSLIAAAILKIDPPLSVPSTETETEE